MSISASTCHYLRALGVSGIPSSVTQISIFAWAKSTADNSAYRAIAHLDSADASTPATGVQLTTSGGDGIALRVAEGGTEAINVSDTDPSVYWWQGGNRNTWHAMSGWIDTTASAADAAAAWDTTQATAAKNITNPLASLLDDIYVLRGDGALWFGAADNTQPNLRIAHLAIWFGYKLTSTDRTNLVAGTSPQDIGTGATKRFYWPLVTQAGDGLVDDINGVTLTAVGGSATETWHDTDNPTVDAPSGGDTTAPILTSASVTSVGTTTATGNVTTDEGNGTLYSVVSTSATAPNVAQIQAGNDHTGSAAVWASGPITVSSTGAKTTSITGLTASTSYYAHFQHKDAANNNSSVVTSAQFTTLTPDSTNPTMTGSVTISAKTTTSYTATWSAGSDNVAVTGYEYRLNAGSWVDLGSVLTVNISARTPGATDTFEVRAYDAAGNRATALSQSITLFIGTITIPAVKDWGTGNLKTAQTGVQVDIHNISTGALVVRKTGQTTHATTGVCVVQDAAIADATTYEVITRFADGSKGMWDYTASLT